MASRPVQIGLIGCGDVAQTIHLKALARLPGVRVVALADVDEERLDGAGRFAPHARRFVDYQALLAYAGAEAVIISLPPALHAEAAAAAFAHKRHVYLEKPLATSLDEGRQMLAAWRQTGTVGMIGFNYRFDPLYAALKQHLHQKTAGAPVAARSVFSLAARPLPAWKQQRATGGGVLLDLASHHVDLIRFLFDQDVSEVVATTQSRTSEWDNAVLQLRLESGVLVQSFFSLGATEEDRVEIYGHAGKLAADRHRSAYVEASGPTLRLARLHRVRHAVAALARSPTLQQWKPPRFLASHLAALRHFAACVRAGRPASPDLTDGFHSLAVVLAAEVSAQTGQAERPAALGHDNLPS
jgi:myo-inositol 2-dehydrogenase/D-chiro-inositol 1-dehydrogenase